MELEKIREALKQRHIKAIDLEYMVPRITECIEVLMILNENPKPTWESVDYKIGEQLDPVDIAETLEKLVDEIKTDLSFF